MLSNLFTVFEYLQYYLSLHILH